MDTAFYADLLRRATQAELNFHHAREGEPEVFILTCHNQNGLPLSTYTWQARINDQVIAEGTVVHRRKDGWKTLVRRVLRQQIEEKERNPYG